MTKESAGWLIIRFIGLVALGYLALCFTDTASLLLVLQKLYAITGHLAEKAEQDIAYTWVQIGLLSVKSFLVALLCFYFLRHGRAVHRWLMRESK